MALVVKDRVKETTTTTGTGALSLAGAVTNFIAFSAALSDGDTTYYAIVDNTNDDFEVGLGTYASAGNTLTRTTVLASSNAGSAVNLSAGTKDVFVTYPADKSVYLDAAGDLVGQTIKTFALSGGTADGTTIGGTIAAAGTFTNLTASGTLSFPDNSISGDDVDGGTISNFASTGIDDNASSTAITIDSSQQVGIGTVSPAHIVDIVSSAAAPTLRVRSTDGTAPSPKIVLDGSNDATIQMVDGALGGLVVKRDSGAELRFKNTASEIDVTGKFTSFASTGIDDNAASTTLEIDSNNSSLFGFAGAGLGGSKGVLNFKDANGGNSHLGWVGSGSADNTASLYFTYASAGSANWRTYDSGSTTYVTRMSLTSDGTVQFNGAIEEQQYSLTGTVIDPANGTIQYKTLGANTTFTESLANGEYVTLMIDDGAGYTITWPTTTWVGGSAPTLETSGYNVIELWHVNGTLYGAFVGAA